MDSTYSFGYWLRRRRKALDLTQEQLADRAGCVVTTIKKIEADARRPSKQLAEILADVLAIPAGERAAFLKAARGERGVDELALGTSAPELAVVSASPTTLPTGTVTFLFTDIEGSTQLWEHHPAAMTESLARHDTILRATIEAHDGVVFKTVGDAFHAAFATAVDALAAALDAQRMLAAEAWGETRQLRVRMVLHTGTAELRDGDYFGQTLNRTARLLAAGHGGQILLSLAAAELVREHLPPETELRDLGLHRLKDLSLPEQIFQLLATGLPSEFPPLQTLNPRRTNLPVPLTALIGREHELAGVMTLLRQAKVRLVTLTGPGGIGKTRLSLQIAAELSAEFPDGVYFVDLAPIRDASLVAATIAHALGMRESGALPLFDQLKDYLREKQMLLLLDNFEQVLDAATIVAELLAAAPYLKVLVTSRERLHVRGEKEISVQPLGLPDPAHLSALEQLSQYAAVELFVERAIDARADFELTSANAPAVAEICARLDGLPLAIELAAARLKLFSPEALLARLSSRLALLSGGQRDLPVRQQTIRSTIAWSYDLLTEAEQRLFRRLGVFVGGCTIEAAEAVWLLGEDDALDIIEGITALVDKSLLRQTEGLTGELRVSMLETIREYALERLVASGEAEALGRRHAEYFVALAEAPTSHLGRIEWNAWRLQFDAELDNLRAAVDWSHSTADAAEQEMRLVAALADYMFHTGMLNELRHWIEQAHARRDTVSKLAQAKLLSATSQLAFSETDNARSLAFGEKALILWQQLGDRSRIAETYLSLAILARNLGDLDRSLAAVKQALQLFRALDDSRGIAAALLASGDIAFDCADYSGATALFQEGLTLAQQSGNLWTAGDAFACLARVARAQGDYAQAIVLYQESLARYSETDAFNRFIAFELGKAKIDQGDYMGAAPLFRELIVERREARWTLPAGLEGMAAIAAAQGEGQRAARLWGAAEAARESIGVVMDVLEIQDYLRWTSTARAQLDEETFAAAWAAGRAMTLDQAIAYALEGDNDGRR